MSLTVLLQHGGAVAVQPAHDVPLADDPADGLAVGGDHEGADPVLVQQVDQGLDGLVGGDRHDEVTLAADHVGDEHSGLALPARSSSGRSAPRGRSFDRSAVTGLNARGRAIPDRLGAIALPPLRRSARHRPRATPMTWSWWPTGCRSTRSPPRTAQVEWRPSPGGLVTAMEPVMQGREGAWVGWTGEAGRPSARSRSRPTACGSQPIALSGQEVEDHYEGFSQRHPVADLPRRDRPGPVPAPLVRRLPPGQPPVRRGRRLRRGAGGDGLGARLPAPARAGDAPHAAAGRPDRLVQPHPVPAGRAVRPDPVAARAGRGAARRRPARLPAAGRRPELPARRTPAAGPPGQGRPRHGPRPARRRPQAPGPGGGLPDLGRRRGAGGAGPARPTSSSGPGRSGATSATPSTVLLGIDRLDYTKGIRHRLKAFQELLSDGAVSPPETVLVQVATPEPRARRRLSRAARPGRGHGRADQRRGGPDRHARRALPAPQLPQGRDGGALPRRATSCS